MLDVLADNKRTFNLRELAEVVSERDEGDAQTDGTIERVAIELYHNHLPRLQDAGLVRYELESDRVKANHQAVSDLRRTPLL